MDYYQILSEYFQDTIEAIACSVDSLAGPIEVASLQLVQALLADHKIMVCGNGVDGALAQLLASNLMNRFEHERPALPALALNSDGATLTAIAHSIGNDDIYARQVRALGQAGDVLLCISSSTPAGNLVRAIQAAHERNVGVVALSNSANAELPAALRPGDVELRVDCPRQPRVVELHTMIIHCLCDLIEQNLFGSYTQE